MSRRRTSHSESLGSSASMNEAFAYPYSGMQQQLSPPPRRGPIEGPNGRRLIRRVTWRSSSYKLMASLWVLGVFYIVWLIRDVFYLPLGPLLYSRPSAVSADTDFFAEFAGYQQCGISSLSLFKPPGGGNSYCQTRDSLLHAMSNGGRHGFDAAYTSQDCSYKWYTSPQICNVLQKFDGMVFVGDESLADVYAGFNILLREDLELGSLKTWDMSNDLKEQCRCDSQFTSTSCLSARISSSKEVDAKEETTTTRKPYACSTAIPHEFLTVTGSPAPKAAHDNYLQLVSQASASGSKPVPVIHSLSFSASLSLPTAKSSMDEWLGLARSSGRSSPFLWLGPASPGHRQSPGDNVHASSWQYTLDTFEAARERGVESLGMYNATLQADSWDGLHYGEKVSVMQAMMIINWLDGL